jgi:hypothetical protein
MEFRKISNYHSQVPIYMSKFTLFDEMMLIYQFTILKKSKIKDDDDELFEDLKEEYFNNVDEKKQSKDNLYDYLENINQVEEIFINNDFCSSLATYSPNYKYENKCKSIFNGLNLKGYDNMISTTYNSLFFLYDDLINMIDNNIEIDAYKLMSDEKFIRLVDNYRYVFYDLNNLFVGLIDDYIVSNVNDLKALQNIVICMVVSEIIALYIYYLYIDMRLVQMKRIIDRIENMVGDTINFCP